VLLDYYQCKVLLFGFVTGTINSPTPTAVTTDFRRIGTSLSHAGLLPDEVAI